MSREQWLNECIQKLRPEFEQLAHPLPEKMKAEESEESEESDEGYESDHLSERYYDALADLGARLARLALDTPGLFRM